MDLRNIVKMNEIKKVNSLEELRIYDVVEAKINGKEKTVPVLFIGNSYEWYDFLKRQDNEENILDVEVNRHDLFKMDGFVNIKESNSIQRIYTPYDKGYYYRKGLLVNSGLWRKQK